MHMLRYTEGDGWFLTITKRVQTFNSFKTVLAANAHRECLQHPGVNVAFSTVQTRHGSVAHASCCPVFYYEISPSVTFT